MPFEVAIKVKHCFHITNDIWKEAHGSCLGKFIGRDSRRTMNNTGAS